MRVMFHVTTSRILEKAKSKSKLLSKITAQSWRKGGYCLHRALNFSYSRIFVRKRWVTRPLTRLSFSPNEVNVLLVIWFLPMPGRLISRDTDGG